MKHLKYIPFIIALLIASSSCGGIRKVSIGKAEYQGLQLKSLTSAIVNVGIEVNNPTNKTIYICGIEGVVRKGDDDIVGFKLEREVVVEPGHTGFVTVPLNTRLLSLTAMNELPIDEILNNGNLIPILRSFEMPTKITVEFGGAHRTKRIANLLELIH